MKITESWSIPKMRIYPELYDDVKKLYEKFGQSEVDQETVAQLWGHKSAKSSQFGFVKLGSLRTYGLIEGRGKIKVSDLGKHLTFPENEEELMNAIVEAVRKVPLWKMFFDTFTAKGADLPTDTLWMNLRRIVGEDKLPPEEAKNKANILRKAYFEDLKYYKLEFKPKKEEKKMDAGKIDTSKAKTPSAIEELKFGDNVRIWLPKEGIKEAWKKAKKMIDIYLGIEKES
jgi:hypothetical protein